MKLVTGIVVLMMVLADPLPVMVRLSVTSRSPDAAAFSLPPPLVRLSVKVPLTSNTMVSAPAFAFEAIIAERRVVGESVTAKAVSCGIEKVRASA